MRPRLETGQATLEFALVSVVLVLLLAGAIEFGQLYAAKLDYAGAARAGARWAATHPNSWTAAASPASNTIEGHVLGAGGASAALPNQDANLLIEYFAYSGGTVTACGHYSVASAGFVGQNGYSQSTCLVPGSLIRVTVNGSVNGAGFNGLFGAIAIKTQATMPELS